jgi:hypothetical protein
MADEWTERFQCPRCRKTGVASLRQEEDSETPIVLSVSSGFKVIDDQYGPQFGCETCDAPCSRSDLLKLSAAQNDELFQLRSAASTIRGYRSLRSCQ